jgi:drug/metabolite transporter (DMT)-like permease
MSMTQARLVGRGWLVNALTTVVLFGVWGAFTGLSARHGFPDTLVYCVWALTLIPPALFILHQAGWRLDRSGRAIAYGLGVGLSCAGGQIFVFYAAARGPAYLIFPIISMSPVVTIVLSFLLMGERTGKLGVIGIVLALLAVPALSFEPGAGPVSVGAGWLVPTLIAMTFWGVQSYLTKSANHYTSAESIFFYEMLSALMLIPIAWAMTDFSRPINWHWDGPWLAAGIQLLNAIGALTVVFAFRYGKAIIVASLVNVGAPLTTVFVSMAVLGFLPAPLKITGIVLALMASLLLAVEPDAVDSTALAERSL